MMIRRKILYQDQFLYEFGAMLYVLCTRRVESALAERIAYLSMFRM